MSSSTIHFFIEDTVPAHLRPALEWWIHLFSDHFDVPSAVTNDHANAVVVGPSKAADIFVSTDKLSSICTGKARHYSDLMTTEPLIYHGERPDYITTIFYLVNSIQEYDPREEELDALGRYTYTASLQCAFDCLDRNLVGEYFAMICKTTPSISHLRNHTYRPNYDLSFDIDFMRPPFLQQLQKAIKCFDLRSICKIIAHEFHIFEEYTGIPQILALIPRWKSPITLYWLPVKGKQKMAQRTIHNADYDIQSSSVRTLIDKLSSTSSLVMALHKSGSPEHNHIEELRMLPFTTSKNRNHYLHLKLPQHYDQLENSGILEDSSLGYAHNLGFRNSYDRPFRPFNLSKNRPYHFVERPIHVMDTYLDIDGHKMEDILDFISLHKSSDLTLVWHNSSFWDPVKSKSITEVTNLLV